MGEARRRDKAETSRVCLSAAGVPVPRPSKCPACNSRAIVFIPAGALPHLSVETATCRRCSALWETFPDPMIEDPVCAEPCDNCAFRPGSPEQQDKEKWRTFVESLRPKGGDDLSVHGRFYCHKNVPIDLSKGPGNFVFPKKPVVLDGKPVLENGKPKMIEDQRRMRTCSGYLRMIWSLSGVKR